MAAENTGFMTGAIAALVPIDPMGTAGVKIDENTPEFEVTDTRYTAMRLKCVFELWPYVQEALNSPWSNIRSICYGLICSMLKVDVRDCNKYMPALPDQGEESKKENEEARFAKEFEDQDKELLEKNKFYQKLQYVRLFEIIIFLWMVIVQMYCKHHRRIVTSLCIALALRIFSLFLEFAQWRSMGTRVYLSIKSSWIANFNNIFFFVYFGLRMNNLQGSLIPDDDDMLLDQRIVFPFLNIILILSTSLILMINSRAHDQFGKLSQLIWQTLTSIRHFIMFFFIWLVLFGLMIQISGAEIAGKEDY